MPGPGSGRPSNWQDIMDFLAQPMDGSLDLSTRPHHALVNTFGSKFTNRELVRKTEKDLLGGCVPNFGRVSLAELKEELSKHGAHLGMDLSEYPLPEEAATPKPESPAAVVPIQKKAAEKCLRIKGGPNEAEIKDLLVTLMSGVSPRPDLHLEIDPFSLFALPLLTINEQKPFAEALQKGGLVEVEIPITKLILKYNPHARTGTIEFKRH